jgi:hypothetical protein
VDGFHRRFALRKWFKMFSDHASMTLHADADNGRFPDFSVAITSGHVKWFLICIFQKFVGVCRRRASANIPVRKVRLDEGGRVH